MSFVKELLSRGLIQKYAWRCQEIYSFAGSMKYRRVRVGGVTTSRRIKVRMGRRPRIKTETSGIMVQCFFFSGS